MYLQRMYNSFASDFTVWPKQNENININNKNQQQQKIQQQQTTNKSPPPKNTQQQQKQQQTTTTTNNNKQHWNNNNINTVVMSQYVQFDDILHLVKKIYKKWVIYFNSQELLFLYNYGDHHSRAKRL